MNRLLTSGGQSIRASASAPVLPMNSQVWIFFRIDWFDLPDVQGTLRGLFQHQFKGISSPVLSLLCDQSLTSIPDYWKNHGFDLWIFVGKVRSLLFNALSRFVIAFLPRSKCLLNSWMQSPSAPSEPSSTQENKICHCFHFFPIYLHEVIWPMPWSLFLECWILSQLFHSPLFPSSGGALVTLHFLALEQCHLHIWGCWYFSQQSWFQLLIHPAWHFPWCTQHRS